jgi:hypothetical protein
VQRQYGMKPGTAAQMGSARIAEAQSAQAEQAQRADVETAKKAGEFNAAQSTIQSDPRYIELLARASSPKSKFIDVVSEALKGGMATAWEEGDKAGQYEGDSAGAFAGPGAGLEASMQGNDQAYEFAVQMGGAHRAKQQEQEGEMALDLAGKIIPTSGLGSAAKMGAQALGSQAIQAKAAGETIKVNKVLVKYLMGTPVKPPQGERQEQYEAARLTVAAQFGSFLAEFAGIEDVGVETLPDFSVTQKMKTTVDSDTDWDAVTTRPHS